MDPEPDEVPMLAVKPGPFGGETVLGTPPRITNQLEELENQPALPPPQITAVLWARQVLGKTSAARNTQRHRIALDI
jgi:hypothetical protein